ILDLRGNGGGLLNEAVNIVNIFVRKGETVVTTKGRIKERNQIHRTTLPPVDTEIPLVILVDKSSASASEIVAGSIQDLDRGVIVGQMTFGKGLVQNIFPLSYNTRAKITVAKYYIPSGRCIQKIDYSNKNNENSGEIPDSLRKPFKTAKGRIVYDGAGIEPDILVKEYEYSNIAKSLVNKNIIFDYATTFRKKINKIPEPDKFIINDSIFNDFLKFISNKDYDYETNTEKTLQLFKQNAEKEMYFSAVENEYNALKQKIMHNKQEDIIKFKDEICYILKQEIVARYYYQKGRIIASMEADNEIKKAIEVINNPTLYNSILNGTYNKANN
ncbi:MAG TPA: S41 family peptidase, partial [Bacteroidales bacterium]|nr:S41 family peptidase [Bacteroidales bacterium]